MGPHTNFAFFCNIFIGMKTGTWFHVGRRESLCHTDAVPRVLTPEKLGGHCCDGRFFVLWPLKPVTFFFFSYFSHKNRGSHFYFLFWPVKEMVHFFIGHCKTGIIGLVLSAGAVINLRDLLQNVFSHEFSTLINPQGWEVRENVAAASGIFDWGKVLLVSTELSSCCTSAPIVVLFDWGAL